MKFNIKMNCIDNKGIYLSHGIYNCKELVQKQGKGDMDKGGYS